MDVVQTDENQNETGTELAIESDELLPLGDGVVFEMPTFEVIDWNTSLVCQFCREGDVDHLRMFIEFSQLTASCAEHASEMADRLDVETDLSPLHHAARYQRLDICLMLLSNLNFKFGVNIRDRNDRTPVHSAFRSSNRIVKGQGQLKVETDFGNQIQSFLDWQEEYKNQIQTSVHPLIYLFAKANGDMNARDKYLLTPLHCAVAQNHLAGVKQLIICNANIESEDRQGIRPLHIACREGYLAIVEHLIDSGAEINAPDIDHWTPVHFAAVKGHLAIFHLIEKKRNAQLVKLIRMKTNTNATCLHLAVQSGNTELVQYIIDQFDSVVANVIIDEKSEPFGTPLHIAAKFCDPSMIKLLHDLHADPLIVNSDEQTALHLASEFNRWSIVDELCNLTGQSLLEIKDNRGQTALMMTTNLTVVDRLIEAGSDVTTVDHQSMNPLMIAVRKGQISIVERLISISLCRSASIFDQVERKNDRSVFLIGVETGNWEICQLLLNYPMIRWNSIDKRHMNLFHIAARHNHYALIQLFSDHIKNCENVSSPNSRRSSINSSSTNVFQNGSSKYLETLINAQTEDGKSPLHFAAEFDCCLSIGALLKNGADPLIVNHLGQQALHIAVQNGHSAAVDLLLEISAKVVADFQSVLVRRSSPLASACQNGFVNIVRSLLDREIGVHDDFENNENPLELAINSRKVSTVEILLEHPQTEYWLQAIRTTEKNHHQTPLRELIKTMPNSASHAFDKFIIKSKEIDDFGMEFERSTYNYKFLDDYFQDDGKLYTRKSSTLYRNHPLTIALDQGHHSLLEHPLAHRLMARKWKLYRSIFWIPHILSILLFLLLSLYVLIVPVPIIHEKKTSDDEIIIPNHLIEFEFYVRWILIRLPVLNLLKVGCDIIIFRGLRVPFAQILSIISSVVIMYAFSGFKNLQDTMMIHHWQIIALALLFQLFHVAVTLRSVPFFGNFMVLLESILMQMSLLIFLMLPLFTGFIMAIRMIFFNQASFKSVTDSIDKFGAMLAGEIDSETLLFQKSLLIGGKIILVVFLVMITIALMNLLLGITVGDIRTSFRNAQAKANAYWIRELIFIETSFISIPPIRSRIIEREVIEQHTKSKRNDKTDEPEENLAVDHPYALEMKKLSDILDMFSIQAKQTLESELELEHQLSKLFHRNSHSKLKIAEKVSAH